jgi:hypothetical protein
MSEENTPQTTVGFIVLWRMPQVDPPYSDLNRIAAEVGFPQEFVPQTPDPKKKRNLWEKATALPGKGLKVSPPAALKDTIQAQFKVEPIVRLSTKIISNKAPRLVRHIIREVFVAIPDDPDKEKLARDQYRPQTAAILTYDTAENKAISEEYYKLSDNWVNGTLDSAIQGIYDKLYKLLECADADMVRNGVRSWLLKQGAILLSSGGAYFVPMDKEGTRGDQLKSAKAYVEALTEWSKRDDQGQPVDRPQMTIIPADLTNDAFNLRYDLIQNVTEQFAAQVNGLLAELQPVFEGERTANISGKLRAKVVSRFNDIESVIERYRDILADKLPNLDEKLAEARRKIEEAAGVNTFRKPARRGLADDVVVEVSEPLKRKGRIVEVADQPEVIPVTRKRRQI